MLHRYKTHFTKIPGKCKVFEYKFQMQGGVPKSRCSRAIPFALRKEVREQIQEMIRNGVLEISYSPYVNPLTLVQREGKSVCICIDAREVNKYMVPDKIKVQPIQEMLQRFHGASFISSVDLNCAFLQIPLEKASREWTAFQFEGQVYQFTRVPYGYRNALAGFIRALQVVLRADSGGHVLHYVHDIIIYSKTYDEISPARYGLEKHLENIIPKPVGSNPKRGTSRDSLQPFCKINFHFL